VARQTERRSLAEHLLRLEEAWRALLAKAKRVANEDGQVVIVPGDYPFRVDDVEPVPVKPRRKRTRNN
jgi:hypothetical protein